MLIDILSIEQSEYDDMIDTQHLHRFSSSRDIYIAQEFISSFLKCLLINLFFFISLALSSYSNIQPTNIVVSIELNKGRLLSSIYKMC
jgi:hypothetical protein